MNAPNHTGNVVNSVMARTALSLASFDGMGPIICDGVVANAITSGSLETIDFVPAHSKEIMASDSEQRDADRIPILHDLHGEIMVFEPLQIKDISWAGASIQTVYPLVIDTLHDLRLTLGARSVVLKARVTHSRIIDVDQAIVTYRSGVEFVEPPDRVRSVIGQFLSSLLDTSRATSA